MKKTKSDIALEQSTMALEVTHQTSILVEGLRSDFRLVIEKVDGQEERINRRIDALRDEMNRGFSDVGAVLKYHSTLLQQNEGRWEHNEGRWKQNEGRWEQNEARWQENEARWEQNDRRLERIENKLDRVIERVDRHDEEIGALKAAIAR